MNNLLYAWANFAADGNEDHYCTVAYARELHLDFNCNHFLHATPFPEDSSSDQTYDVVQRIVTRR